MGDETKTAWVRVEVSGVRIGPPEGLQTAWVRFPCGEEPSGAWVDVAELHEGRQDDLAEDLGRIRASLLEDTLRELVTLKDGPRDEHYATRKPIVWGKARRLLGQGSSSPLTEEELTELLEGKDV